MSSVSGIRSRSGTEANTSRGWSHVRVVLSTGRNCDGRISLHAGFFFTKSWSIASSKDRLHLEPRVHDPACRKYAGKVVEVRLEHELVDLLHSYVAKLRQNV